MKLETKLETLWAKSLPEVKKPESWQFLIWLEMSRRGIVKRAIARTGRKYRNSLEAGVSMTQCDCERYVTSIIVKERDPLTRDSSVQARKAAAHA